MLKQILLASCVLGLASSVAAADITNPFYLPTKGQMGSITSAGFEKLQIKNEFFTAKEYSTIVDEELRYGLTDTLALIGAVGNTFVKAKTVGYVSENRDENMAWRTGLAWNILTKAFKLQATLLYGQDKLYSTDGEYKYAAGQIKFGYQFDKFLPYVLVAEELPIAQAKGNDKPVYTAKVGLYQGKCNVWSLDTGIRWTHSEDGISAISEINAYTAEAEASYYLAKNTTIGVYGTYTFEGTAKYDTDVYDKSVGVRLRWFF